MPHLVRVNVVVQDQAGNPVAGLTRDDFILLDDGRPQAIQEFAAVTNQPVDQYTPAMEADTYSNRFEDHARVADSVTAVLLDGVNTRFEDQAYARRQTVKFLEQIQPGDHVAVYVLGRELRTLLDFSSDAAGLLAALKNDEIEIPLAVEQAHARERLAYRIEAPPRDEDLLEPFLNSKDLGAMGLGSEERLHAAAVPLAAIANHLAAFPGRKSLVWVSGDFPTLFHPTGYGTNARADKKPLMAEAEEAARALNAADVAIYPVDAWGLMQPEQMLQSASLRAQPDEDEPTRHAIIDDLATFTGGRALERTRNIFNAIRTALADSAVSYELGYYADSSSGSENVHSLAVSVRRVGMQVHVRRGYVEPGPLRMPAQARRALLANAAMSPLEATGIGVSVRVKAAGVPGAQAMNARVRIESLGISFLQDQENWKAKLDVVFVQLDAQNRIVDSSDETFDLNFSAERLRQAQKDGLTYSKEISLQPDAAAVRVVVRDATTGATGSVAVPLATYVSRAGEAN